MNKRTLIIEASQCVLRRFANRGDLPRLNPVTRDWHTSHNRTLANRTIAHSAFPRAANANLLQAHSNRIPVGAMTPMLQNNHQSRRAFCTERTQESQNDQRSSNRKTTAWWAALGAAGGAIIYEIITKIVWGIPGKIIEPWMMDVLINPSREILGLTDNKEPKNLTFDSVQDESYVPRTATQRVENSFRESEISGDRSSQVIQIVLLGVSGCGKTEVAKEIARLYDKDLKRHYPQRSITIKFFNAENPDILRRQFIEFAQELDINLDEDHGISLNKIIPKVNAALSKRPHFLLLFDNVNDYDSVASYIPIGQGLKGRVLFTSQTNLPSWSNVHIINLNSPEFSMSEREAISLFDNVHKNAKTLLLEDKANLVKQLIFLPVAIKAAAASLKVGHYNGIAEYLDALNSNIKNREKKEVESSTHPLKEDSTTKKARHIISAVYHISYNCLRRESQELLSKLCIYLNPDIIPRSLTIAWIKMHRMSHTSLFFAHTAKIEELLEELIGSQLLIKTENGNFQIHRRIQETLRNIQTKVEQDIAVRKVIQFISHRYTTDFRYELNSDIVSQPEVLLQFLDVDLTSDKSRQDYLENNGGEVVADFIRVFNIAGNNYMQNYQAGNARQMFDRSHTLFRSFFRIDDSNISSTGYEGFCKQLAKINRRLPALYAEMRYYEGKLYFYTQSQQQFQKSIQGINVANQIRAEIDSHDQDYEDVGNNQTLTYQTGAVGYLLLEQNLLPEAEMHYRTLLTSKVKGEVEDRDYNQMICSYQLAKVYFKMAKQENNQTRKNLYFGYVLDRLLIGGFDPETKNKYEAALQIANKLQRKSMHAGEYYIMLGNFYKDDENPQHNNHLAKHAFKDALLHQEYASTPIAAKAQFGLAEIYIQENDLKNARASLNQCWKIRREVHRNFPNHPEVIEARELAKVIRKMEARQEAQEVSKSLV